MDQTGRWLVLGHCRAEPSDLLDEAVELVMLVDVKLLRRR
jgi:hypothetical protein